jgi:hypothetical protein
MAAQVLLAHKAQQGRLVPQARQAQQVLLAQLDRQDQQLQLLLEQPLQAQQAVAPL